MFESWPREAVNLWEEITGDSRCILKQCDLEFYHPMIPPKPPHELWVAVWNRSRTKKHPMIRIKASSDGSLAISFRVGEDSGLIGPDRLLKPIKGNPSDVEYGQRRVSQNNFPDELFDWIRLAAIFTFSKHKIPLSLAANIAPQTPDAPTLATASDVSGIADQTVFPEGRARLDLHHSKERNRAAIEKKKSSVLASTGSLACEVCDFDFIKTYGLIGNGFAECHHIIPMSELTEEYLLLLSDLAIVCSNCHRMLHRSPFHSLAELKSLVLKHRTSVSGS